jgi:hypothetical protein
MTWRSAATEEEIASEIDAFERTMTLEEGQAAALDRDTVEELLGAPRRSASDIYREYLDVSPPRAALAMKSVLASMLLRLPADHAPDPRLQLYPGSLPPVTGKVFRAPGATRAAFMGAVRRQEDVDAKRRLVVGDAGVSLVIEADLYATICYERCVALVRWPQGARTLVERDGSALIVDPVAWEDGAEAVRMIDSRFPPAMTVEGFVKGG